MTLHSWLPICSSTTCRTTVYDATIPTPFSSDTTSSSSSLQSNLSLQTLPSIPSLQHLSQYPSIHSLSHLCVFSYRPRSPNPQLTALAVSGALLYAAFGHEVGVFQRDDDLAQYAKVDAFGHPGSGSVKSLAFSNGRVFTAHQDCKIRVWRVSVTKRHQLVATLPTVADRLSRFVLPKNYVTVRRHKKRLWIEHVDAVSGLAVGSPNQSQSQSQNKSQDVIYSVSWDRYLKIWRSKDLVCLESVKAHEDAVNAVAVNFDGTVYTGSADKRIRVWGKTGEKRHGLLATLEKHKSAVNALALSQDGSVLYSGACDRSILVWEREDSAHHMVVCGALRGHKGAILCLVNVSKLLFSGSADRTIRIWRRSGERRYTCLSVMEGHEKPVKSLVVVSGCVSEGVVSVCSGSLDGEIKVWRVETSNRSNSSSPLDLMRWRL